MTDFRAIAGVSRSLRSLLLDRIEYREQFFVTVAPPDVAVAEADGTRLNLYLYRITENRFLKNQEIPGSGHPAAFGRPPLALELHYLMTAFSADETLADADVKAQLLLGAAMRVLHDYPVITDDLLITKPEATLGDQILDASLVNEFEALKIVFQPADLDDYSKIWSAIAEGKFRRSVAYQVSVIQIETRRRRRYPRPVGEPEAAGPRLYAVPFRSPWIRDVRVIRHDDVERRERQFPYARVGDFLILRGRNLVGADSRIRIGGVEATGEIQDRRVKVAVPDAAALQPGPRTALVVHRLAMGEPEQPHVGFESNAAVFMLVPEVDTVTLSASGDALTLDGSRLYHPDLESLTLVDDEIVTAAEYTSSSSTSITFDLPAGLGTGEHTVRVRVNGAETFEPSEVTLP